MKSEQVVVGLVELFAGWGDEVDDTVGKQFRVDVGKIEQSSDADRDVDEPKAEIDDVAAGMDRRRRKDDYSTGFWAQVRGEDAEERAAASTSDRGYEDWGALDEETGSKTEYTQKEDREEEWNTRFKLRNGREVRAPNTLLKCVGVGVTHSNLAGCVVVAPLNQVLEERTYLIGVEVKTTSPSRGRFSIGESLKELGQLAETAGLAVVGSTVQRYTPLTRWPTTSSHPSFPPMPDWTLQTPRRTSVRAR